jgi:hypothetical protein
MQSSPSVTFPLTFLCGIILFFLLTPNIAANGDDLGAVHRIASYEPGSEVTVAVEISYTGSLTALAVNVLLPAGSEPLRFDGEDAPPFTSQDVVSGSLDLFWILVPESPVEFSYTFYVPENVSEADQVTGSVLYRRMGGEEMKQVIPHPLNIKPEAQKRRSLPCLLLLSGAFIQPQG